MVLLIDGYMGCPAYPGTWHAIRHIVLPNHIDLPHIGREVCLYIASTYQILFLISYFVHYKKPKILYSVASLK